MRPFGRILGRLVGGLVGKTPPTRLLGSNPRSRLGLRPIRRGSASRRSIVQVLKKGEGLTTELVIRPSSGGGGSRTRVHTWIFKRLYVRSPLRGFAYGQPVNNRSEASYRVILPSS